jgi:serine/threonine protein kinase
VFYFDSHYTYFCRSRHQQPATIPDFIQRTEVSPKTFFTNMVKIGGGAYGNVFLAKPKSTFFRHTKLAKGDVPTKVAIKTCKCRCPADFVYIKEEVKLHREIQHNNFVRFVASFFHDNFVWIIMDLCDSGSLYDVLRRRPKNHVFIFKYFSLSPLSYSHYFLILSLFFPTLFIFFTLNFIPPFSHLISSSHIQLSLSQSWHIWEGKY